MIDSPVSEKTRQRLALKRRREVMHLSSIHLLLLAGCVIFAFPFVWLVSTSFKDEREIAKFPPQWVPRVPYHSLQSPFVDPGYYDPMKRPDLTPPAAWSANHEAISRALDESLAAACQAHADVLPDPGLQQNPEWRAALRNGMWEELSHLLPDKDARDGTAIAAFVRTSITPDRLKKVAAGVSRVLLLGELRLLNARNDLVPFAPSEWRVASGNATIEKPVTVEAEKGPLLRYDLSKGPVVLERDLNLAAMAGRAAGPDVSQPENVIDSIALMLRLDASWHRAYLTLESAGGVYQPQDAFWMERSSWQEQNWKFVQPQDRTLPVVVLKRDADAKSSVTDPHELKLRLRLEPSSRLAAGYAKYSLNYRRALRYIPFWRFVWNSVYLVILNVLGQVLACSLVAYGFARLRFWGRDILFGLLLATMMLPGQVTMIPVFLIFKGLGWYDTLKPLWVGSFFGSAFFIFLLRQFFLSIPKDLEDAAKIDGCGFFGTYWRILLPLVRPALATVAIFTFMGTWNEFMGPLIYIGSEHLTPLSLGLYMFRSEHGGEWGMMMAASTLMTLPVIVIFFFAQRYFIQGVTLTGMGGK